MQLRSRIMRNSGSSVLSAWLLRSSRRRHLDRSDEPPQCAEAGGLRSDRPPVFELEHYSEASSRGDHGRRSRVDGVDDLGAVDPLQVNGRDAEVGVPELALNDDQWHALMRHLDRVRVTELMRCEPTAHARLLSSSRQLLAAEDDSQWRRQLRRGSRTTARRPATGAGWPSRAPAETTNRVGAGLTPAPPTPPDVRVRIRRFAQHSRKRR
jgi:hypothetical protein